METKEPRMNFQALTDAWRAWAQQELTKRVEPERPEVLHIRHAAGRNGRPGYSKRHFALVAGYQDPRGFTLCGAAPTLYDRGWRDRHLRAGFDGIKLCARCAELTKEDRQ